MSVPAFAWALEQGARLNLLAADRLVLIYLADLANGEKVCWPGLGLIESYTGLSPNTVRTAIHRLAQAQLIRVETRSGYTNRYHILRDVAAPGGDSGTDLPLPNSAYPSPQTIPLPSPQTIPLPSPQTVPTHSPQDVPTPSPQMVLISPPPPHDLRIPPPNRAPEPKKEPRKERKEEYPQPRKAGSGVRRADGTNPRAQGTNPRTTEDNLRLLGENPRAVGTNPRVAKGREVTPAGFEAFWNLYPRKVGKRAAAAAFTAAVNRGNDPADIVAGLRGYRFHADPQFQPHPTTWLRGDRWLDELEAPALSVSDQMRRDWGLKSFLTPDFDDEPPAKGMLLS